MKTCKGCGETKSLDQYHRNKAGKHGRIAQCKTCVRAYKAEYNARPEVGAHRAEYKAANPHISWVANTRIRAKHYGYTPVIEPFTLDELIARWGDECFHCKGEWTELDHWPIPLSRGGHHVLENCRPSCTPCNRSQGVAIRESNTTKEMSN